ncbi:MAG: hypothetical protein A2V98_17440 [Planctomycetes bacterium RBG_16_64_12]|nr:MAG: hypothetical protein A2V98_17440 [Planctomycetes bacterium RBG_16_64_12]
MAGWLGSSEASLQNAATGGGLRPTASYPQAIEPTTRMELTHEQQQILDGDQGPARAPAPEGAIKRRILRRLLVPGVNTWARETRY